MGETRNCFKFITTLTKLLGSFPVTEGGNKVIFQWCSFRTFCFFILLLVSIVRFLINIYENKLGYVLAAFDISGIAIQISFLIIAINWSELAKECDKIDLRLNGYGFPKYLKVNLYIACVIFLGLCLVIYSFYNVSGSKNPKFETYTLIGVLKAVVKSIKQDTSSVTILELLFKTVQLMSDLQCTVLRVCADIFVITASVILAMRFGQIAERIDLLIQRRVRAPGIWAQIGEDYQHLNMFCEKWDNVLGYLVLCSFMSNLYGVIIHIQCALMYSQTISKLYCTSASVQNLLRCMIVCYTAGNVYEESRQLVRFLLLAPSDVFNDEIEGMILQYRLTQPALTGKQLFTVKHSLILQILGGIAVHEIIILQYYYAPFQSRQ